MKKPIPFIPILLALFFVLNPLAAQDLPLLAVPSISAVEVPEALAGTCRNIVETALLKTGKYTVLSYTDIEDILAAQAFSLQGCVSDSCAIEIGELLAADNIVVGELSRVGEGMVLALRMVNVTSSRTLNAEIARIEDLAHLQDAVFSAAYSLAGLRYTGGTGVMETGGIYVTAPGALVLEVFLNGFSQGRTPLLIEDLPFGVHLLEAKGGDYHYSAEISIASKDITEISADVSLLKGNLFIALSPPEASGFDIFIDGASAAPGLVRGLPIGNREVYVSGGGWHYRGTVKIETGKTARLTAALLPAGNLSLSAPEGADITLTGPAEMGIKHPANTPASVPVGEWEYRVEHPDFETASGKFTIARGETAQVRPAYAHNTSWEIRQRISQTETRLERARKNRTAAAVFEGFMFGIGGAALASALTGEILIQHHLANIEEKTPLFDKATDPEEIRLLDQSISGSIMAIDPTLRNLRNYSLITAAAGGGAGFLSLLLRPKIHKLEARLDFLKAELEKEAQK